MLDSSRVIVVNKFSNLESKIMSVAALVQTLETDEALLDEKQKAFLYLLKQTKLEF